MEVQVNRGMNPLSDRARIGSTIDYFTILFALWLLSGVFIDGYAHGHLDESLEIPNTTQHAMG